jgi:hypothetical protein
MYSKCWLKIEMLLLFVCIEREREREKETERERERERERRLMCLTVLCVGQDAGRTVAFWVTGNILGSIQFITPALQASLTCTLSVLGAQSLTTSPIMSHPHWVP